MATFIFINDQLLEYMGVIHKREINVQIFLNNLSSDLLAYCILSHTQANHPISLARQAFRFLKFDQLLGHFEAIYKKHLKR